MVYLSKRVEFSAAHRLSISDLSPEENERLFGKCCRPSGHGHNYLLEVTVCGEADPVTGMVMNLSELKALLEKHVLAELDHSDLNRNQSLLKGRIPTTENLAKAVWEALKDKVPRGRLHEVKIWETSESWAAYREEG